MVRYKNVLKKQTQKTKKRVDKNQTTQSKFSYFVSNMLTLSLLTFFFIVIQFFFFVKQIVKLLNKSNHLLGR